MESLQHKLASATKVAVDETDAVRDVRKQFEVLSSVIKELRLTGTVVYIIRTMNIFIITCLSLEEVGTETRILLDKLQKGEMIKHVYIIL